MVGHTQQLAADKVPEKRFSILADLQFWPTSAERRKILRTLRGAQNEIHRYLGRRTARAIEGDGKHDSDAQR